MTRWPSGKGAMTWNKWTFYTVPRPTSETASNSSIFYLSKFHSDVKF